MRIAVVVPSYKVSRHILAVITGIGPEVERIYVVDDACPEKSGDFVLANNTDKRVQVLFNPVNLGVGGATMHGYRQALNDGYDIVVKVDGDGQMDVRQIAALVSPIVAGQADYAKGNRFFDLSYVKSMPLARLLGNSALSFVNKFVSGYWNVMDPTNGFTAIHSAMIRFIPLDKIEKRYFFESDMLFCLGTIRAVVADVPLPAKYGDEVSNLRILRVILDFPSKYASRFLKRIFFCYFLRDFNAASIALLLGIPLLAFGIAFGIHAWLSSALTGVAATSGTVMLAALPAGIGLQFLLAALAYDVSNTPKQSLHGTLSRLAV